MSKHRSGSTHLPISSFTGPDFSPDLSGPSSASKHDSEKNMLQLLPLGALEAIGEVFTYGATKYGANNWRKGLPWSRLLGALLRHIFSFAQRKDTDEETKKLHLAHAGCCLLMLLESQTKKIGEDDRI
jgi:hypothetical protein